MKKRFAFECWNCPKIYFQTLEITNQQEITISCPYCNAEAVVNLRPYYNKTKTVLRGQDENRQGAEDFQLPSVFLTKKPE